MDHPKINLPPDYNLQNISTLGVGHYVQQIATMGLTVGTTALATYLAGKGVDQDLSLAIAIAVGGFLTAFLWGRYQRLQLLQTPAPSQTVVTTVLPPDTELPVTPKTETPAVPVHKALGLIFLILLIGGCSTSAGFKTGMRVAGPLIADEGIAYTDGDGTLTKPTARVQKAQAERLKTETAGDCEYVEVKSAWLDVRPWYLRYVQQDARLTETERGMVLKTVDQVDGLVGEEAKRRGQLFLPE